MLHWRDFENAGNKMKTYKLTIITLILTLLSVFSSAQAKVISAYQYPEVRKFIQEMSKNHGFSPRYLTHLFKQVKWEVTPRKRMTYTKKTVKGKRMPWWKYKQIMLSQERINEGVDFWKKNASLLKKAEKIYGVPAYIIVATLGVETHYGKITGNHYTLQALTKLAFIKNRRNRFFRNELKEFLLLAREQKLDPLKIKGSYAGALGWPQFMPSNYRRLSIKTKSSSARRHADLFNEPADIIFSIANYYSKHGWKKGDPVLVSANVKGKRYHSIPKKGFRPIHTTQQLKRFGISSSFKDKQRKAIYFGLQEKSQFKHYLGFHNFFVITRYNPDRKYSMAVYSLGQAVKESYQKKKNPPLLGHNEKKPSNRHRYSSVR
jgi:membrane-bound lytic murein transglycosylase B